MNQETLTSFDEEVDSANGYDLVREMHSIRLVRLVISKISTGEDPMPRKASMR